MKTLLPLVLLAAAALFSVGCESDMPPTPRTERPIVRGLSGQGQVVPIDQKNDPMINHAPGVAN